MSRHPPGDVPPSPDESLPIPAGLCASCVHARRIRSSHESVFLLCTLSFSHPGFPKYPSLPIVACDGYAQDPVHGGG